MRHRFSVSSRRILRWIFAAFAVGITLLAVMWVVDAARDQHAATARANRAARLQSVIDLAQREQGLVVANGVRSTTARGQAIDAASTELMHLLRSWGADGGLSGLSSKYGVEVLLADTPGHARKTESALLGIRTTAARALVAERTAALADHPRSGLLADVEVTAAALAGVEGPLLLFWVLRRHRRRLDLHHQHRVDQLSAQARTDSLTRLGNRRAFDDDLGRAIGLRAETGQTFTLMAIDLDGLKRINDSRGHPAGDVQIRAVAECVAEVVGDEGLVYRTGGDEFMVLLPARRAWHGLNLAARIDQLTRVRTGARAVSIGLTESIGMEGRHLLMNQADVAMYEAKRTRLSAIAYHPGLSPTVDSADENLPTHEQRALAAALARAVDAKDAGTRSHSETVSQLCVAIGERLRVESAQLERLRLAGLLHDVGKIGVADAILQKPEALGPDEQAAMTEHVEIGQSILLAAELPIEARWVLHHHERVDGEGYPERLRGATIPIESRIIAVADAFEAMTGARPYREAISAEEAIEELRRHGGTQFDTRCVEALVEVVNDAATEDDLVGIAHGGQITAPLAARREALAVPAGSAAQTAVAQ